jgi:hypothetical protein
MSCGLDSSGSELGPVASSCERNTYWFYQYSEYIGCNWKVRTNSWHEFYMPKQEKMFVSAWKRLSYSWKSIFTISSQNVLREIQCTPRHVSLWTVAPCNDAGVVADRLTDIQSATVPLCCQQELHTQRFLGNPKRNGGDAVGPPLSIHRSS